MASYDFKAPRLFVDHPLHEAVRIPLERAHANYLVNVLRLGDGETVLVFNGRDGEWRAGLALAGRRDASLVAAGQTRPQTASPDLLYLFAPLKHARLDYMVQKAVEMGAGSLRPVFTQRTQSQRVNLERMRANVIEAAEQCGILSVPGILPDLGLDKALRALEPERILVFCDEDAPAGSPVELLSSLRNPGAKLAVIVGPEGGFTDQERALVAAHETSVRVSLGPRILRADTAAVAALALVQATLGDWAGSGGQAPGRPIDP
ncbi:MAG: 16S rRNA (uracil(1498)-N(3))-methyltransferase [Microvirga sp.]